MDSVSLEQARRLEQATAFARSITPAHREKLHAYRKTRHVRPTAGGVTLVSITDLAPQVGESFKSIDALLAKIDKEYLGPRRPTPEKHLQSALVRDAYVHDRHLRLLELATAQTDEPVELLFVSDELKLPLTADGKTIVCDLLALRVDGGRCRPAVIELKSSRDLTRLREQVNSYADVVRTHAERFADFYSAVLQRAIRFDAGGPEKWIVWPRAEGRERETHAKNLSREGIRVIEYTRSPAYGFVAALRVERDAR